LLVFCHSVGQKKDRVIGGSVPVHGDHIVCIRHILAQGALERFLCDDSVCGDEREHGAHVGVDHAGALCHAADGDGRVFYLDGDGDLLLLCICSHNGLCRLCPCFKGGSFLRGQGL